MIKILDNSKSLDTLVNDNTNGLGQLQPISAYITEELNGIYEADIEMLATDKHFKDLNVGSILKMTVNERGDEQMFRIYNISKPMNEKITLHCQHITYDLNKVPVKPFSATGAVNAKNGMINNILGSYPFTMSTNIDNTTSKFTLSIPKSFRECLGGYEGSLLDTFRCEYEWDNLEVKMLNKRGNDNNVRIAYGKNLTDFKQEENIDGVYTSVLGYAVVDERTYTGSVYHKVQATYPKVMIVDFSSDYNQGQTPTTDDLTTKAQEYATRNAIEVPSVNLTIAFVPLYQTEEYKNIAPLERVSLGDTVHVFFEKLNVEASARVTKTIWDVNLNRYSTIELGNTKANLTTVLNDVQKETLENVVDNSNFVEAQLNDMTTLIINGLGLHRTYVPVEGGGYRMYLHNKQTLAESDTQYVFGASGFLISNDYGQTWNAGFDSQGNAVLNSLATITLRALDIYGATITGSIINLGTNDNYKMTLQSYSSGALMDGFGNLSVNSYDGTQKKASLDLGKDANQYGTALLRTYINSLPLTIVGATYDKLYYGYRTDTGELKTGLDIDRLGNADLNAYNDFTVDVHNSVVVNSKNEIIATVDRNTNITTGTNLNASAGNSATMRVSGKGYVQLDNLGDAILYGSRNVKINTGSGELQINGSRVYLDSSGFVKWSNT